ncbi:MAG TPA: aconitase family protein, partial [Gaiellaceae bacterium]|nr:aconitase family protein [Gaiellaceae bacterium]
MADTFGAFGEIQAGGPGGRTLALARLGALAGETDVARLPYTLRVLLENVLRAEALGLGSEEEVRAVAGWDAHADPSHEISFRPARVLLQDFTGVPAIVDLAAMREAMVALGGDAAAINPQIPAELVIDH